MLYTRLAALFCLIVLLVATSSQSVAATHHIRFGANHRLVERGHINHITAPSQVYIFAGRNGERLKIDLVDILRQGQTLSLVTMYHITFPGGQNLGMKGYTPFGGLLTQNGRYAITVEANQMASNSTHGRFRLTLTRW